MLSKLTTDQIRKEAEGIYKYHPIDAEKNAYIKGCETWAIWKEKAEVYEKALKEFISMHETGLLPNRFTYQDAIKAL